MSALKRLKWRLWREATYYQAYLNHLKKKRPVGNLESHDYFTHLHLDGFPRAGQSATKIMIERKYHEKLRLSHHCYSIAALRHAYYNDIPTLIFFRDPRNVMESYIGRDKYLFGEMVLLEYTRYYSLAMQFLSSGEDKWKMIQLVHVKPRKIELFNRKESDLENCIDLEKLANAIKNLMKLRWRLNIDFNFQDIDMKLARNEVKSTRKKYNKNVIDLNYSHYTMNRAFNIYTHLKNLSFVGGDTNK